MRVWTLTLLALVAFPAAAQEHVIDDGTTPEAWTAAPSPGVRLNLFSHDDALHLGVDFGAGGGYAIARRAVDLDLPARYAIRYRIRADRHRDGREVVQDLEVKLVDAAGENVWWHNRRAFRYPSGWTDLATRDRHVSFAWGPRGGGPPTDIAFIEFVVTAVDGGRVTVSLDDITVEALPDVSPPDAPLVASGLPDASLAVDGDAATTASFVTEAFRPPALTVDLGARRELGGIVLDWAAAPPRYEIALSDDGDEWTIVGGGYRPHTGPTLVPLPESEARFVRVAPMGNEGVLGEVSLLPVAATATRTATLQEAARRAAPGVWPRSFAGEQMYWTVVGQDVDDNEALIGEDGHVETRRAGPSLEPSLFADGHLLGWHEADTTVHALGRGSLPLPSVEHRWGALRLRTSAFASDADSAARADAGAKSGLYVTYDVTNDGSEARAVRLLVALRPFQVNPPPQFLGTAGGAAEVRWVRADAGGFVADSVPVAALVAPDAAGAATFAQGGAEAWIAEGTVPPTAIAPDLNGLASGALAYDLTLEPGETQTVVLWTALHADADRPPTFATHAEAARFAATRRATTAAGWAARLDAAAQIHLPPSQADLAGTVRTVLANLLINRDGPRIQPGSRSYDRSWIRDGALTSEALLRFGLPDVAEDFARWYAPFQAPGGFVPCCVGRLGADWTPEHDSHGQLAFLVAEIFRTTGDRAFLAEMWPHVRAAANAIDSLRALPRATARPDTLSPYAGLLPASISHEGYSARPMHSYWDGLFGLLGLKDAAFVADVLGAPEAAGLARRRDAYAADLRASYPAAMARRGIDYLPGSVELGDFDPTSVSVALDPVDAGDVLPAGALERTFERYWDFFVRRRDTDLWTDYTPYEWRNVGALVRLGQPERAHEAAAWFLSHRRPAAWHAFAEVVGREPRRPRFLGDIPHGWVGSDFLRAVADLFAYDDRTAAGDRLVLGAGVPLAWLGEGVPVGVAGLRTHEGPLTYTLRREDASVVVEIAAGLRVPPGGIVVHAPFGARPARARLDGRPALLDGRTVVVRALPARLVFSY